VKRRTFIGCLGLTPAIFNKNAFSQEKKNNIVLGDVVIPKERVEKREYDRTVPQVVVWRTGQDRSTVRTVGFVEAASDDNKILYIPGFLLRKEIYPDLNGGFYLYFKTSLGYLSLPRRLRGQPNQVQERYAFDEQLTATPADGVEAGLVMVDYKKMRLIEDGQIYSPESIVLENGKSENSEAYNALKKLNGPISYPGKDMKTSDLWVSEVLYFSMDHVPLNFTLELPPLVINGANVPFPVCHFEPYNILTKKWG
jgi:hypothetical protein